MIQRWVSAALLDAEQHFRRVRGFRDMPRLMLALDDPSAQSKQPGDGCVESESLKIATAKFISAWDILHYRAVNFSVSTCTLLRRKIRSIRSTQHHRSTSALHTDLNRGTLPMSETPAHRRAKNRAAGTGGKTEAPISGNQRLDALSTGGRRATEVERSGSRAGAGRGSRPTPEERNTLKSVAGTTEGHGSGRRSHAPGRSRRDRKEHGWHKTPERASTKALVLYPAAPPPSSGTICCFPPTDPISRTTNITTVNNKKRA